MRKFIDTIKQALLNESYATGQSILITDLYDTHELTDESEALMSRRQSIGTTP